MENTLQLIDSVLQERKIRWSYADGLYTLRMGSLPAFIQVESDRDIQVYVREEEDDPMTDLYRLWNILIHLLLVMISGKSSKTLSLNMV